MSVEGKTVAFLVAPEGVEQVELTEPGPPWKRPVVGRFSSSVVADFWSEALDYRAERLSGGEVKLYPPDDAPEAALSVLLQPAAGPKNEKNRNHPDLTGHDGDVEAEVERLIELGAKRVDVGQRGDKPFVVLADPEGNEFCLSGAGGSPLPKG